MIKKDAFKDITDDVDFAKKLYSEQGIFLIPTGALRFKGGFVFSTALESELYKECFARLGDFCKSHSA
jgi:aspartate/methionine/tyrosine aminotransferase